MKPSTDIITIASRRGPAITQLFLLGISGVHWKTTPISADPWGRRPAGSPFKGRHKPSPLHLPPLCCPHLPRLCPPPWPTRLVTSQIRPIVRFFRKPKTLLSPSPPPCPPTWPTAPTPRALVTSQINQLLGLEPKRWNQCTTLLSGATPPSPPPCPPPWPASPARHQPNQTNC